MRDISQNLLTCYGLVILCFICSCNMPSIREVSAARGNDETPETDDDELDSMMDAGFDAGDSTDNNAVADDEGDDDGTEENPDPILELVAGTYHPDIEPTPTAFNITIDKRGLYCSELHDCDAHGSQGGMVVVEDGQVILVGDERDAAAWLPGGGTPGRRDRLIVTILDQFTIEIVGVRWVRGVVCPSCVGDTPTGEDVFPCEEEILLGCTDF